MTIEFMSVGDAIVSSGLRVVVVPGVSVGWNEAAKAILHFKGLPFQGVRLDYQSEPLRAWTGQRSGPVVVYERQRPRSGWAEILLLAERLAPEPSLLPKEPEQRAWMFGYAHELCAEAGLGWMRRLQLVHAGLQKTGGFPEPVARYLGKKYGYDSETARTCGPRVVQLLGMLAARLRAQREAGSRYYLGESVSALDIYSAAFLAMFAPLTPEQCPMDLGLRAAFETLDDATAAALDPILLEHRSLMYERHLPLPLVL